MRRFAKIAVSVPAEQLAHVRRIIDAGEFRSAADVMREALRSFLDRRRMHAGELGARRFSRSLRSRVVQPVGEVAERVELLFDAGDAKA